jgi:hypothetical protein
MEPGMTADVFRAELANPDQRFHEVHEPEVNVSGNVIVGVMTASVARAVLDNALGVRNPALDGANVCLRVTSRDGAYRSENEYRVSAPADAPVQLPYRSGMKRILTEYAQRPGAIAVSVTRGSCAQSGSANFLVPSQLGRQGAALKTGDITLLINGFDATDVYYHVTGMPPTELRDCRYIEEGRRTAFNFICEIPAALLAAAGPPLRMEIVREVYGRELEPLEVELSATP